MSKYDGFLTPAYATKTNKSKDVPENCSSCELPFSTVDTYVSKAKENTDGLANGGLIRIVTDAQLNLFQRIVEENFEPVTDEGMLMSIVNISKIENGQNTVWRLIAHAGNLVPPEISDKVYYDTFISRIAVTDKSIRKAIDGYSVSVMYGWASKLNTEKERAFRQELIGSFLC